MSHPTRVDIFEAWAKAMVKGATVGKPNYGKAARTSRTSTSGKRRKRRRKKKKNAQD